MIEIYFYGGPGYRPLLIREGWQFAQLNLMPELRSAAIHRVERQT